MRVLLWLFLLFPCFTLNAEAQSSLVRTQYGFSIPSDWYGGNESWVIDVPGEVVTYSKGNELLCYWPLLGAWSVDDYPEPGAYLSETVHIRNITYRSKTGVYSGYTTDGRIWYMKKNLMVGREVTHSTVLVLIYPKAKQKQVEPLIKMVNHWTGKK